MATNSKFFQISPNGMNHEALGELFADQGRANYGMLNLNPNLYWREGDAAGGKSGMIQGFMKISPEEVASGRYGDKVITDATGSYVRMPAWQGVMQQHYNETQGGGLRGLGDFITNYGPLVMGGIGAGLAAGAAGGLAGAGEAVGSVEGAVGGSEFVGGAGGGGAVSGGGFVGGAGGGAEAVGGIGGALSGGAGAGLGAGALTLTQLKSLFPGVPDNVLSGLIQGGLGVLGADAQGDALKDIYNQMRADRMPALNAFNSALANPDTFYSSAPAMGATDAILRRLSVDGNPAMNPGLLSQAAAYNLGGYNDYLRGLSSAAFGTASTEGGLGAGAAGSEGQGWNALGYGLGTMFQPPNPYQDLFKNIKLSIGGVSQ